MERKKVWNSQDIAFVANLTDQSYEIISTNEGIKFVVKNQ